MAWNALPSMLCLALAMLLQLEAGASGALRPQTEPEGEYLSRPMLASQGRCLTSLKVSSWDNDPGYFVTAIYG